MLTWELLVDYYCETTMNAVSAAAYHNIIVIFPSALSAFVVHCFIKRLLFIVNLCFSRYYGFEL